MKIVFFGNDTEKIAAIRYRVKWHDGHESVFTPAITPSMLPPAETSM